MNELDEDIKEVDYTMAIRGIKNILRKEDQSYVDKLISSNIIMNNSFIQYMHYILRQKLADCATYEDLEEYVHGTRRMSLTDWIRLL